MHLTPRGGLTALCLGLCLPLTAFAQGIPFDTVARGPYGGQPQPAQVVARNAAQFQAAGLDQLLPVGGQIDWDQEMVIAVFMGTRSTGGYGIEIERVELSPLPPPPVGAPVNPMHFMDVSYRERSPAPGSIVTMALTQPYHVIKLARDPMAIVRFQPIQAAQPFGTLTRTRTEGFGRSTIVRVDRDGQAEIIRVDPAALIAPVVGQATQAEQDELARAVRVARLDTLPSDLSPNQSPPFVPMGTSYAIQGGAQDGAAAGGWTGLFDPAYAQRLAPVDAALDAIVARLTAAPAPDAFESASLVTEHPFGGSSAPMTKRVVVDKDGKVGVYKSHPTAKFAPSVGRATQGELDALAAAIRAGDLAAIPSPLPVVIPMWVAANPFTLEVSSLDPQHASQISGQLGQLGPFDAQLGPVIVALETIGRRVETGSFPPASVAGEVQVSASGGVSLRDGNATWDLDDAFAADLRKFEGRRVRVSGDVTLAATAPGAPFHGAVKVDAILDPVRQRLTAVIYGDASNPAMMLGSIFQTAPLQRIEAFGRAARVLELAVGREITADAWLFHDAGNRPTGAYLESVEGQARRFAPLTIRGQWRGYVRRGDAVEVQRLSSTGRYARVRAPHGYGYMRSNRLELGRPLPAITPGPQPFSGAGVAGAVSSATGGGGQ